MKSKRWPAIARFVVLLSPLALTGMGSRPVPAAIENDVQQFNQNLLAFFRPYFMLPVTIPAGQSVGDVYEYGTWVLAERAAFCFPGLPEPRTGSTSLPALTRIATQHLGFALGLDKLLDLGASVDADRAVELRFRDLRYAEVAQGDLRRNLAERCNHLRPVVEEQPDRIDPARRPPIIIGRLISGRKQVFIGLRDTQNLLARADALRAILATAGGGMVAAAAGKLPVEVRVALEGEFGLRQGLVIETTEAMPIAFQPAFIIDYYAARQADMAFRGEGGATRPGTAPRDVPWMAFEPRANALQREIFDSLSSDYLMRRR
jgi:hypothetical protein